MEARSTSSAAPPLVSSLVALNMLRLPLFNAPLDIVFEVLSYLESQDLLHLARTNKSARKLLMTRKSAHMWRRARENTGADVPPPPDYMNEPQLADLLFSNNCQKCLQDMSKEDSYDYDFPTRFCNTCVQILYISESFYVEPEPPRAVTLIVDMSLDHAIRSWDEAATDLMLDDKSKRLSNFLPTVSWNETVVSLCRQTCVVRGDAVDLLERLQAIGNREGVLRYLEGQEALRNRDRKDLPNLRNAYGRWCTITEEKQQARDRAVAHRLIDEGWGEEYQHTGDNPHPLNLMYDPVILRTAPIQDYEWAIIKPRVIELIGEARAARLKEERRVAIVGRLNILAALLKQELRKGHDWPSPIDAALGVPEIRDVLLLPNEAAVDVDTFQFLHKALRAWVPQWREQARRDLANAVHARMRDLNPSTDPSDLAVAALFRCTRCQALESFPQLLSHTFRCERFEGPLQIEGDDIAAAGFPASYSTEGPEDGRWVVRFPRWQACDFRPEVDALRRLVERCGLDPRRATVKDMDSAEARLAVLNNPGQLQVMDWVVALQHCIDAAHHATHEQEYDDPSREISTMPWSEALLAEVNKLVLTPPNLLKEVSALEAVSRKYKEKKILTGTRWICSRCEYSAVTGTEEDVVAHLGKCHDIADPSRMYDYVPTRPSKATRAQLGSTVYLISKDLQEHDENGWRFLGWEDVEAGVSSYCDLSGIQE